MCRAINDQEARRLHCCHHSQSPTASSTASRSSASRMAVAPRPLPKQPQVPKSSRLSGWPPPHDGPVQSFASGGQASGLSSSPVQSSPSEPPDDVPPAPEPPLEVEDDEVDVPVVPLLEAVTPLELVVLLSPLDELTVPLEEPDDDEPLH